MNETEEQQLQRRLTNIHRRIQWMADQEAVSAWVQGAAAQGGFFHEKERLIAETEAVLDKLEAIQAYRS